MGHVWGYNTPVDEDTERSMFGERTVATIIPPPPHETIAFPRKIYSTGGITTGSIHAWNLYPTGGPLRGPPRDPRPNRGRLPPNRDPPNRTPPVFFSLCLYFTPCLHLFSIYTPASQL